jgi:hypothetical protein
MVKGIDDRVRQSSAYGLVLPYPVKKIFFIFIKLEYPHITYE